MRAATTLQMSPTKMGDRNSSAKKVVGLPAARALRMNCSMEIKSERGIKET